MADGIGKGVANQFAELGKQVVQDLASVPGKLTGLDSGTSETSGAGAGSSKKQGNQKGGQPQQGIDPIAALKQKEDSEKQQQLANVRRRLAQLMNPNQPREKTAYEIKQDEEMEKKKQELWQMQQEAKQLKQSPGKRPRGDLYGVKAKQFGGEKGKNVVSQ